MKLGNSTVEVGDWLRAAADDWEGQVVDVTQRSVTLRMSATGEERKLTAADVYWNTWDPKAAA